MDHKRHAMQFPPQTVPKLVDKPMNKCRRPRRCRALTACSKNRQQPRHTPYMGVDGLCCKQGNHQLNVG